MAPCPWHYSLAVQDSGSASRGPAWPGAWSSPARRSEGSLTPVFPEEVWAGRGRESPGQESEWQPSCFLIHFLSWQLRPTASTTVAERYRGALLPSSDFPVVCLTLGTSEQSGWGWESPRDHWLPCPGSRRRGKGQVQYTHLCLQAASSDTGCQRGVGKR